MTDHTERAQLFLGAGDGRYDKLAALLATVEREAYERAERVCRERSGEHRQDSDEADEAGEDEAAEEASFAMVEAHDCADAIAKLREGA